MPRSGQDLFLEGTVDDGILKIKMAAMIVSSRPLVSLKLRRLVAAPESWTVVGVLLVLILGIASVGVYSFGTQVFDLYMALAFGVAGYAFRKLEIPRAPLIFGLILGGLLEQSFRQAMTLSSDSPLIFVSSPIAVFLLCCSAISVGASAWARRRPTTSV